MKSVKNARQLFWKWAKRANQGTNNGVRGRKHENGEMSLCICSNNINS